MVNNLEIGLYTILRFLYDKRNLENDFEFWIQGKIWLTLLATQRSRNVNFDEAQTNDINVSKKKDVCGFERISNNLLLQIQDKRSKR